MQNMSSTGVQCYDRGLGKIETIARDVALFELRTGKTLGIAGVNAERIRVRIDRLKLEFEGELVDGGNQHHIGTVDFHQNS